MPSNKSMFGQTLQTFRDGGNNAVAVLQPNYGASQEFAITTTSNTQQAVTIPSGTRTIARVYSVGCPAYVKMGATGLGAATNLDAYIPSDGFIDIIIDPEEPFLRAKAVSGTGLLRVEYFR